MGGQLMSKDSSRSSKKDKFSSEESEQDIGQICLMCSKEWMLKLQLDKKLVLLEELEPEKQQLSILF